MKKLNLKNSKMTGVEVGKLLIKDLLFRVNSALQGNGDISLFADAELKAMINNLTENHDIREYNKIIKLMQFVERTYIALDMGVNTYFSGYFQMRYFQTNSFSADDIHQVIKSKLIPGLEFMTVTNAILIIIAEILDIPEIRNLCKDMNGIREFIEFHNLNNIEKIKYIKDKEQAKKQYPILDLRCLMIAPERIIAFKKELENIIAFFDKGFSFKEISKKLQPDFASRILVDPERDKDAILCMISEEQKQAINEQKRL